MANALVEAPSDDILSREVISLNKVAENVRFTQFHYGSPRVDLLVKRFASWDRVKIQKFLDKKPIPYILGPDGKYHIVDRHHLHRALDEYRKNMQKRGIQTDRLKLTYERKADLSNLETDDFHEKMIESKWMFPYYHGKFRNPDELPKKMEDMQKDFYRGLAWIVREGGGFEKTDTPFSEFYWAEYFRDHLHLSSKEEVFGEDVILRAMRLAIEDNQTTRKLPGHIKRRKGSSPRSILYGNTKKLEEIGLSFGHLDRKHRLDRTLKHIVLVNEHSSKLQVKAWRSKLKGKSLEKVQAILKEEKIPFVSGPDGKKWVIGHSSLLKALYLEQDRLQKNGRALSSLEVHFREIDDFREESFEKFKASLHQQEFIDATQMKRSRSTFMEDPRFLEDTIGYDLLYLSQTINALPKNLTPEQEISLAKEFERSWPGGKKLKPKRVKKFFMELSKNEKTRKKHALKDPPYRVKKLKKILSD